MSTLINNIDFGPTWCMSGALNFFGQGWWYDRILETCGLDLNETTFVSKTTTLHERKGEMPLKKDLMPTKLLPDCIYVNWKHRCMLNAVSLSGPGAAPIVSSPKLYERRKPFQISFMSVAATFQEKLDEQEQFNKIMLRELPRYQKNILGIQHNLSCPNTTEAIHYISESIHQLNAWDPLVAQGVVIIPKISVDMPLDLVLAIGNHRNTHALCTSNTVRFGNLSEKIDWEKLFPHGSPLLKRKFNLRKPEKDRLPGGLSGKPLLPLVVEQIKALRDTGFIKPINGGGGVLSAADTEKVFEAGANSISLGSVAILAPWNIPGILETAQAYA